MNKSVNTYHQLIDSIDHLLQQGCHCPVRDKIFIENRIHQNRSPVGT